MHHLESEHAAHFLKTQGASAEDVSQALAGFDLSQPLSELPLAVGTQLVALMPSDFGGQAASEGGWFGLASGAHGPDRFEVAFPMVALAGTLSSTRADAQPFETLSSGMTIYVPGTQAEWLRFVPPPDDD